MRIKYNLDNVKTYQIPPGKYLAVVTKIEQNISSTGKPMLVWHWKIVSGVQKGSTLKSWTSLAKNALGSLKTHLQAFGYSGKVNVDTRKLKGQKALIVVGLTEGDDGRTFSNIMSVYPPSAGVDEDDFEDEDDFDEDEDDYDEDDYDEDDFEDDEDEDDDDFDDDFEDDDDLEPEPPKKKLLKKKKAPAKKKRKKSKKLSSELVDEDDIPF